MFILYDLIFLLVSIFFLPRYIFRKKFHQGFLSRFGVLPRDLNLSGPIWIHAVSVGEAMAIRRLVEDLRKFAPLRKIVISTVTPTGNKIARDMAKKDDFVTYLPLDFGFIVRSVIAKIRPSLFIIAETEIWPNLISCLYSQDIPVVIVNGRISNRSFLGYSMLRILLKPILNKITLFCVQSQRDAQRLLRLGVSTDKIQITGNMKFDLEPLAIKYENLNLRLQDKERLWVCGSTHSGEEEMLLSAYESLNAEFPDLRLLIAPRHPGRACLVDRIIREHGFDPLRVSQLTVMPPAQLKKQTVFVLDTIGQLLFFYNIADLVFVGGSLVKRGGHNILEPAALEKPILFGPYMFNFSDIAELFLSHQAALRVADKEELILKVKELLSNPSQAQNLGHRAKELMQKNAGSTQRNVALISRLLP
jgi:3-deoxy-D-manno-octulosonic-acid transferase